MSGHFADAPGDDRIHGTLPRPNRTLTALARDVARAASALLPDGADLFMGVETGEQGGIRLFWWRARDLRLVAEITSLSGEGATEGAEGVLRAAAVPLLAYLGGRWPIPPASLGVITDGVGVALVPDHPAPSAPGWLERLAAGGMLPAIILPFDAQGPCALLSPGLHMRCNFH